MFIKAVDNKCLMLIVFINLDLKTEYISVNVFS